ncbi:hypothetical protein M419DRAFT_135197 [Trichoderma reesei RUT C-30]|uniref:Uncharacterized protein n=1 Tax=Hypocrea jecorina (strain ATCC 56765 / BCRC 32924 / NRRL 11460 / Rut C-30) TaxID=1344414 RepID=A0A024RUC7_HYPJR|nr:hypothetical protein M419DRAFT_135197 [Trichoderma reesei RUT C-30]
MPLLLSSYNNIKRVINLQFSLNKRERREDITKATYKGSASNLDYISYLSLFTNALAFLLLLALADISFIRLGLS